ncbi:cytochrome P450 [Mycena amicta]|nr:cytochrome P450 [Mycena amicta]
MINMDGVFINLERALTRFIAKTLLSSLGKPILVAVVAQYVSRRLGSPIPTWATVVLLCAAVPLSVVYNAKRSTVFKQREAASMGARLAPTIVGKKLGNLDILKTMGEYRVHGYPGEFFKQLVSTHGPVFNLPLMSKDMMVTVWPDHIKQILALDFENFEKGDGFRDMFSVFGTGVFNSDGDMWKWHRSMTRPFFAKDNISHFDVTSKHADVLLSVLETRLGESPAPSVDFQDLLGRFFMDSTTEFLFGTQDGMEVDSLRCALPYPSYYNPPASTHAKPQPASELFVSSFINAMDVPTTRNWRGPIWPLFEIKKDITAVPMRGVNAYLDPILRRAVARRKEEKARGVVSDTEKGNLLDELLDSTDDPKVLRDETLNILLAGRDTMMYTMTMVLYFLAIYPNVLTRLRAEVLQHVGPTARPTYDHIRAMKYMRAVINEALRLYSPVPNNQRQSTRATTWPSPDPAKDARPIYVPAGTRCMYSVLLLHRLPELWGPDAEEFDPDRFLDERMQKYVVPNPWIFLPFNGGPRICLGQLFAYNQMSFLLTRLLQVYTSFELDEEGPPAEARPPKEWKGAEGRKGIERFRPAMHLTMFAMGGMWIRPIRDPGVA